MVSFF